MLPRLSTFAMISDATPDTYYDCDSFTHCINHSKALCDKKHTSLLHLNAQSLNNKKDSVEVFLNALRYNFDILVFSETWFARDSDVVQFPGYGC